MSRLSLAFQLSASATGMSQGINAGVVELQKLGLEAKRAARDVSTLKTLEISRAFISGVSAIANTFQQFTSGALNSIDATRQLSQSLGVSFEELRQLQVAADLSGASTESLAQAFTRAQLTISRAAGGSKQAKTALASLGLSVDDLAKQTTTQQFASIANAISQIENPAQRAAAAVAIFGRNGASLLPTFRELPENLREAQSLLDGFKSRLGQLDADRIDLVGDGFSKASQAVQELAGKVLSELQPSLTAGTNAFIKFVQNIDVPAAARTLGTLLEDLANSLSLVGRAAAPLATNLLPAIGGYLAFINRQAIASSITTLASAFAASAQAALGYSAAAGTAATATAGLAVAIRGLLTSTFIGALVVGLGLAAGKTLEWAIASKSAGADAVAAASGAEDGIKRVTAQTVNASASALRMGEDIKRALSLPDVGVREFAQDALNEARSSIVSLAKELGGLDKVPTGIREEFAQIAYLVQTMNVELLNSDEMMRKMTVSGKSIVAEITKIVEARRAEAEATKEAADAAIRAADESRRRVTDLNTGALSDDEKSRLQLNRDLLAIQNEQRNAQQDYLKAVERFDANAQRSAQDRLEAANRAVSAAKEEDRVRRLRASGIDESILRPAETLADQFQKLRNAADKGLVRPEEFKIGIRNLAEEGIKIRRDIAQELSRPANRALEVADIRTQEGFRQLADITNNRGADAAFEQRREQISKLEEIRRGLQSINIRPVDILG